MPNRIAIMQPYLFPYIGYYQLIKAVDIFVEYDDVDFITRGFINRNNILVNNDRHLFTLPVKKASQNKKINEIEVFNDSKDIKKLLKTIQHAYRSAPCFDNAYPIIEDIFLNKSDNLADYLHYSLEKTCDYIGLNIKLMRSSDVSNDKSKEAEQRLIDMTKLLDGDIYINAYGGYEEGLYTPEPFAKENIQLKFIKPKSSPYEQFGADFVSHLSIIDIMMFNKPQSILKLLDDYELIEV